MIRKLLLHVEGMHCRSCEERIGQALLLRDGIREVKANYVDHLVEVAFNPQEISVVEIIETVEGEGYGCSLRPQKPRSRINHFLGSILGILGIFLIIYGGGHLVNFFNLSLPQLDARVGYAALFLLGLVTGFHCIGMCGGFVLGYTSHALQKGQATLGLHLQYGLTKLFSYTLLGALFGWVGSLVTFTPELRGIAAIVAGVFLILYGLNMLRLFSVVRIGLTLPRPLAAFLTRFRTQGRHPMLLGLLNGFMIACGPLQAMYVMAAGLGDPLEGAKVLFTFGLGTLPVMMGFGAVASFISQHLIRQVVSASGVLVVVLGLVMVNRGLAMAGSNYHLHALLAQTDLLAVEKAVSKERVQEIRMVLDHDGFKPAHFELKAGVPVRWIIEVRGLNPCNQKLVVPELGLKLEFSRVGERRMVTFTPKESGLISWSCWMGMLKGEFIVTEKYPQNWRETLTRWLPSWWYKE